MKYIISAALLFFSIFSFAQTDITSPYQELNNPKPIDKASWKKQKQGVFAGFASADVRYKKESAPMMPLQAQWKTKAWKGEKVHTQLLIWTTKPVHKIGFQWDDLHDGKGNSIPSGQVSVNFVRYVMTDSLNSKGEGCGIETDIDSSLAEDAIDNEKYISLKQNTSQPAWLSIRVPHTTPAGIYKGIIKVTGTGRSPILLNYEVETLNRTLPSPADWKFHLDLWQNPYSVSRMHGVEDWSEKHMQLLEPYMKILADAGQKVITASIIHDPWNSQTYDVYKSMIKWTKKKDGSWEYDYTIFDKWVSFMMSLGIDKLINCYSMIPWNLKFYYYDEALGRDTLIVASPGTAEYDRHWRSMLADFSSHLKEKGWFQKTAIAMDERPMPDMQKALAVIRGADKDFKISLAGDYHTEIENELYDYCVASKYVLSAEVMERRKKKGLITTYYTACPEPFPNTFTFSLPAESAFLGWYAAAKGFDGYLRWAYNNWGKNPLKDSRFGSWSAGDTYFVYPGLRSSIRFERLIEGIQAYEKINSLRKEFTEKGENEKLERLNNLLQKIKIEEIKKTGAASIINAAASDLNSF